MKLRNVCFVLMTASFSAACGTAPATGTDENTNVNTNGGTTGGSTTKPTTDGNSTPAKTGTTVSGYISAPAMDGNVAALSNIKVAVIDAATSPPSILGTVTLDTANATCKPSGCPFTVPNVDLSKTSAGLVIYTVDSRTTGGEWAPVATGTASQATVTAGMNKGTLDNQFAFVLNANAVSLIAKITKTANANDIVTKGAFVGELIGNANDTPVNGFPPPVANATVAAPTGTAVSYPDNTLTNATNKTGTSGLFFAVPTGGAVNPTFAPKAAANDKTHTWPSLTASLAGGSIVMIVFPGQ